VLSEEINFSNLLPFADRDSINSIVSRLHTVSSDAINSLRGRNVALAFSGGIDSAIAANLLSTSLGSVSLLALGRDESPDLRTVTKSRYWSQKNMKRVIGKISKSDIELATKEISKFVTVSNLPHFEDCVAFWLVARKAKEIQAVDTLVSANGPDELFCGYDRFRRIVDSNGFEAAEREIRLALESAGALGREVRKVVSAFGLELEEPFLRRPFIEFSLGIPIKYKIALGNDTIRKRIWRYFGRTLGVPEDIVTRPKKAMQYGMGIHTIVGRMLKRGTLRLEFENSRK